MSTNTEWRPSKSSTPCCTLALSGRCNWMLRPAWCGGPAYAASLRPSTPGRPAITKIDFMHNHSGFCDARFVQRADYITIPFSASTLGPRNGAAALDMVNAAIHVTTGATTMNFESGVTFFDPAVLEARTAGMMCPITSTAYDASSTTAASPTLVSEAAAQAASDTNGGMIAVLIVAIIFVVLFIATALFAFMMFKREKEGKPIFSSLNEVEMKK